jgi:hypothetical protein
MNKHPEQSLLLSYIDGELPGRESRSLASHLEACSECRAELAELQTAVADCVRYHQQFLAEALPAPPREWCDIYREFDRADAVTAPRRVFLPWRWGLAAATATLAMAGVYYYKVYEAPKEFAVSNFEASSKITEPLIRNSAESGAASVEVPPRSAVPSRPAATVPGQTASISNELQVMSVLHGIGADLGDPIQVSLSDNRVQVRGVGLAPARQQEILAALGPLPYVATNFSNPAPTALPEDAGATQTTVQTAASSAYQARLEAQLGGRGPVDRFTGQMLNSNESAMAHAYALRLLAQQFPSDASMSEQDRATLRGLVRDHLESMAVPVASFEHSLVPVLNGLGAASNSAPNAAYNAWQGASEQVFQAARRVEVLSSMLLGVTPGQSADPDLPSKLLGAVNELRADLDQNQRLLGR